MNDFNKGWYERGPRIPNKYEKADELQIIGSAERCPQCDQSVMTLTQGRKVLKHILLYEKRQSGRCLTTYTEHECTPEDIEKHKEWKSICQDLTRFSEKRGQQGRKKKIGTK